MDARPNIPLYFEAASIKLNKEGGPGRRINRAPGGRFTTGNSPVNMLITFAYQLQGYQLIGLPNWANNDGYYILQLPATLTASVAVTPSFTPYAAVGYRALWEWGLDDKTQVGSQTTSPRGAGEGWIVAYAGIELARANGGAVLFEYGRMIPVTQDSGHPYWIPPSNLFSIAFRSGDDPGAPIER